MREITADYLRSILDYNPDTGEFTWRYRGWVTKAANTRWAGKAAGSKNQYRSGERSKEKAYSAINIDGRLYLAHVLAWFYMTGEFVLNGVDHKDTDVWNNKWNNLRKCTKSQNQFNRKMQSNNTTGHKGIYWSKERGKWVVQIKVNKKIKHGGYFDNIEDAIVARLKAIAAIHGEFMRVA